MKKLLAFGLGILLIGCTPVTIIAPTPIPSTLTAPPAQKASSTATRVDPMVTPTVDLILTRFSASPLPKPSATLPPIPTMKVIPSLTPISHAWVVARACEALVNHGSNPLAGRLVRFKTPIAVDTAGIPAATLALRKIEQMTSQAVTFVEVSQVRETGIVFVSGDAVRADGTPGCGNVTSQPDPRSGVRLPAAPSGELTGRMYVHLGMINSTGCKYSPNREPYPIAEHEMGHALGLGLHFTNFNGDEGFSNELAAVIKFIYSQPIGTPASTICP